MAFVRTETWAVAQSGASLYPAWLDHRWTSRGTAFVLSLAIEAGVIAMLLTLGNVTPPTIQHDAESIATIDLFSTVSQATSSSASSAQASAPTTPPTKIDATTAPPMPKEWSVTTLPAVPAPSPTPAPPAPPSQTATAQAGSGSTGNATGAGYDPYAYASYRAPPAAGGSISVPRDAIARLEAFLRQRVTPTGVQIAARIDIDGDGRIVRFVSEPGVAPAMAANISAAVLGFSLCPPDPRRSPTSGIAVTLRV